MTAIQIMQSKTIPDISSRDIDRIAEYGKSVEEITGNYNRIVKMLASKGNYVHLEQPLVEKDVVRLTGQELSKYEERYDAEKEIVHPSRFIPASGYSSRMFGYLEKFYHNPQVTEENYKKVIRTLKGLDDRTAGPKFAFISQLKKSLQRKGCSLDQLIDEGLKGNDDSIKQLIGEIVYQDGLNFKSFPKALIPFHIKNGTSVIALTEHIEEVWRSNTSKLCLTISPFHKELFDKAIAAVKAKFPHLAEVEIDLTLQSPKTDSIAINPDSKEIIRDNKGNILFFPGGHGSLLSNIIGISFIKNIDNIPYSEDKQHVLTSYCKAMAVKLTDAKLIIRKTIETIQAGTCSPQTLQESVDALQSMKFQLFMDARQYAEAEFEKKKKVLAEALNRPICIFGLVENKGEPGGGPFYYKINNILTASIIERDEISLTQRALIAKGEFFNPVEILFDPTDYKGDMFTDLTEFEDAERCFLVKKLFDGKSIVRMEHPGLWNGRMAKCNKMWIVVPGFTFAPVKELVDLLNESHQA